VYGGAAPDGYVGLADPEGSAAAIASYLDARKRTLTKLGERDVESRSLTKSLYH
jgi:hypothetical protein